MRAGDEPYVLRSFVTHRDEKRTHVVSVADPAGVHYSYDAEQGSLIALWRGPFMETTEMWRNRGEPQLAVPLGSVVSLPGAPAIAVLPDPSAAWPDSMEAGYRFLGYDLDEARRPVFRYRLDDLQVPDPGGPLPEVPQVVPGLAGDVLEPEIRIFLRVNVREPLHLGHAIPSRN